MINKDEIITSRQNAGVKRACALLDKKSREAERLFRFDGLKLFCEAMAKGVFKSAYISRKAPRSFYIQGSESLLISLMRVEFRSLRITYFSR